VGWGEGTAHRKMGQSGGASSAVYETGNIGHGTLPRRKPEWERERAERMGLPAKRRARGCDEKREG
jgi:hypothetical protein